MRIDKVTVVYFSPTGGTARYMRQIAKGFSEDFQIIDITNQEERNKEFIFSPNELVIFGAPVYAGRLPQIGSGIFSKIKGSQTPALFHVCYGNRDFDDALLEEKNECEKNGFVGIGAAAWITPHVFSSKIAKDRPDAGDEKVIAEFVEGIKETLTKDLKDLQPLCVPGKEPYREARKFPFYPRATKRCIDCRKCIRVCPVGAIDEKNPQIPNADLCISCMACVKHCPAKAKRVSNPLFWLAVSRLDSKLLKQKKKPELFFL